MPMLLLGSLGLPEMIMVFALILLLFGPSKLPEIGKALGKGIREFKKSTSGIVDSMQDITNEEPRVKPQPKPEKAINPPQPKVKDEVESVVIDLEAEPETKDNP